MCGGNNQPGHLAVEKRMHTDTGEESTGVELLMRTALAGQMESAMIQITGISGDTVTWQGTVNGTDWVSLRLTPVATGTVATTATADGIYLYQGKGLKAIRGNVTTYSAGTINMWGVASA